MVPVPGNILSPDDALRRLNRPLRGDPDNRGLLNVKLVLVGKALSDSSRDQYQWNTLETAMGGGLPGDDVTFLARTAPPGKWIWWTVVKQDRLDPGCVPGAIGSCQRVQEYIYIDAVTGKATSYCHSPSRPIPCQEEGGIKPRPDSLLGVTGQVKSASAGKLVIVTDRDMSVSLRKGTEMTFELNQPHLRSMNFQSGDYVSIRYEKQSGRMIAHEITLRLGSRH